MQHPKAPPNAAYVTIYREIGYLPDGQNQNPSRLDSMLGGLALLVFGSLIQVVGAGSLLCRGTFRYLMTVLILAMSVIKPLLQLHFIQMIKALCGYAFSVLGLSAGWFVLLFSIVMQLVGWTIDGLVIVYMGLRGNVMRIVLVEYQRADDHAPL
ncbi:hypothetical protein [Cupriavidus metallidurans]|uniref:hypothetical protein n=1 Tax=Cupriavidus metallidurans TaxID=119219 RepID=UPI001CCD4689|nr:hypothetical protein [Cupriavidus metallidurans]UBM12813.1 hypothetical protein LAI70_28070 [Cupriavidus metallidurans]